MTTAIVGTGVMGETILAGLVRAGWDPRDIVAADRRDARRAEIEAKYGVRAASNADAVRDADTVVLVVKPQDVGVVLPEISEALRPGALVVSVLAGVRCAQLEEGLPAGTPVVRVMPNTPAQVDAGMSGISAGTHAGQEHLDTVTRIMASVGEVVTVPEKHLDALTAVSGSGPAYLFYVAESMIDAGVLLGLPRDVSTTLVAQTMLGSAKLLVESGQHPTVLREMVTSPGGTTAAALRQLDAHGVKAAFIAAMEACRDRSIELGR